MGNPNYLLLKLSLLVMIICCLVLPVHGMDISSCGEISQSGYYTLVADITDAGSDTCIKITASGVTLNCGMNKISGNGTRGIHSNKDNTI
ncbi:MAG: hypothetical protein KAU95_01410, partial [Candidatus Aenigmarchaeota archaeon]|nr:hypothetical protein [Candidatus Aenigmarchaeota archaeon]